jgi:hypothetical protein
MMDDSQKRRLRRTAKWLHWIAQLIFVFVLFFILFASSYIPLKVAEYSALNGLLQADEVFTSVFFTGMVKRLNEVATYVPPDDPAEFPEWASGIQEHLQIPCAVFYDDGSRIDWIAVDRIYENKLAAADSILTAQSQAADSNRIRLGSISKSYYRLGESSLRRYRRDNSNISWGCLSQTGDEYPAFIERLQAAKDNAAMDPDLRLLNAFFRINVSPVELDDDRRSIEAGGLPLTRRYGLRIYSTENDSLLYSTVGVNPENEKYEYRPAEGRDLPPYRWEIYNHEYDQGFRHLIKQAMVGEKPPWATIVILGISMLVLALFYRWILKLTKPETN